MNLLAMPAKPRGRNLNMRSAAALYATIMAAVLSAVVLFAAPVLAETVHLGPAEVYLDMGAVPEPYIVTGDAYMEFHNISNMDLGCTVYPATIGHASDVILQLHELDRTVPVNSSVLLKLASALLPSGWTRESSTMNFDGHPGVMINATGPDGKKLRAAGFSPDEDSGSGRYIFLSSTRICQNCTIALFESFRVSLEDTQG